LIANALAAALLLFLLFSGVLVWPSKDQLAPSSRDTTSLEELQQRADALEAQTRQRVCTAPDGQPPSLTPLPAATPPPASSPRTDLAPDAPQPPDSVVGDLAETVVMVIGKSDDGHSKLGSGFFVTGDSIVTNRHVVDGLAPDSIQIANKALGQPQSARLMATSSPPAAAASPDFQDFALLKVNTPSPKSLTIGPSPQSAANVVAAGYPASAMRNDASFLEFVNGNGRVGPASVSQSGRILQRRDDAPVKALIHSASLDVGSAGGPLVDFCGRIVGVNTQVRGESDPPTTPDQAQDVSELRAFLDKNGVTPRVDDAQKPCAPRTASPTPAAPAQKARK
jgi:S1-C subfamily serine protease